MIYNPTARPFQGNREKAAADKHAAERRSGCSPSGKAVERQIATAGIGNRKTRFIQNKR